MSVGSSTSNDLDENGTNGITNGTNRSTTDSNGTGKSFSEALILASVNRKIQVQNMLCKKIAFFVFVLAFKIIFVHNSSVATIRRKH